MERKNNCYPTGSGKKKQAFKINKEHSLKDPLNMNYRSLCIPILGVCYFESPVEEMGSRRLKST